MAYKEAGNLAYRITDENSSSVNFNSNAIPDIPFELPDSPERRREEYERIKRQRRIEERQLAKRTDELYHIAGKERLKNMLYYVCVILSILGVFAFLMQRQSRIVEQNFNNIRLQNQINELDRDNQQKYEEILSKVDFNEIEQQAYAIYGLRKPAASQRITIHLPEVDRVIRYPADTSSYSESETPQAENNTKIIDFSRTELYMKRLRIQE